MAELTTNIYTAAVYFCRTATTRLAVILSAYLPPFYEKLRSGRANLPGLAGAYAGFMWIKGVSAIYKHELHKNARCQAVSASQSKIARKSPVYKGEWKIWLIWASFENEQKMEKQKIAFQ